MFVIDWAASGSVAGFLAQLTSPLGIVGLLSFGIGLWKAKKADNLEAAAAVPPRLPYLWGFFQGWVLLVVGLFAAISCFLPLFGMPLDVNAKGYAMVSPLLIASGYAFIRRKKYAVLMTYLWLGLYVLVFLLLLVLLLMGGLTDKSLTPMQQSEEIWAWMAQIGAGLLSWGLCAIYYRKRRSEFASELSSKAARELGRPNT